jgi:hypothetical protein
MNGIAKNMLTAQLLMAGMHHRTRRSPVILLDKEAMVLEMSRLPDATASW